MTPAVTPGQTRSKCVMVEGRQWRQNARAAVQGLRHHPTNTLAALTPSWQTPQLRLGMTSSAPATIQSHTINAKQNSPINKNTASPWLR